MPTRPFFSRLRTLGRIGATYFERSGAALADRSPPPGLVDRLDDLARPGLAIDRIHPAVRAFFLAPASLEIRIESEWHGIFALAWRIARPVFAWIGQLHLPQRHGTIRVRTLALDAARDGRDDVRGVIREYTDGRGVMQVMAYATWREGDARYMSAAFPFPPGALCGVLRLDVFAREGDIAASGVRLTSVPAGTAREPVGVWFAPRVGPAFPLPLAESLSLWSVDDPAAPAALQHDAASTETLVGEHEQSLFGVRVATHRYWFRATP